MSRQFSAASLTSTSGRREVSDEDVAEYAKQLLVPRYGAPRVFVTSAKQGVSIWLTSHHTWHQELLKTSQTSSL